MSGSGSLKENLMAEREMTVTDYLFCSTCGMFCDLWKYGSVYDAGHTECVWRYVTKEELGACILECQRHGCFDEM